MHIYRNFVINFSLLFLGPILTVDNTLTKFLPTIKKLPVLIKPFFYSHFNQASLILYKYFCVSENKSVFNWTFCQLLKEKPNCTKHSRPLMVTNALAYCTAVKFYGKDPVMSKSYLKFCIFRGGRYYKTF